MYCYVCFIETGCDSSPALAICQRLRRSICRAHLVESTYGTSGGPGGETRSILNLSPLCNLAMTGFMDQKSSQVQSSTSRRDGGDVSSASISGVATPEEAVESVERFLNHQEGQ